MNCRLFSNHKKSPFKPQNISKPFVVGIFLIWGGAINPCFSQNYSVKDFQKINETNGGFTGILNNNDSWGIALDNIGDLDGNGVNDLAVGAYGDDDGGTDKGAVWILFLDNNDMVISSTKISDTSGNFNGVLDNDDRFGGGIANLGDMNGDGLIELAVTSDYDGDGGFWHGAFWILSLNNDGTVNTHSKISDTQGGFTGFINGDAIFGTDIENIGDLNGDGIEDLAVGSRRDADGGSQRGAVWILFMNADFTVNNYQKISDTQGGFNEPLDFEDYFGGSVLNIGDLDGDGVTDIVTGAYRDDDGQANSGSFYVLFLNNDGTVKNYQKVSNSMGGLTGQISGNALFGESIDGYSDIDNDGKIEIIVGALRQRNPTLGYQTGAFYLIELNSNGTVSEQYLYTYGENCFSGLLNNGDFFGGGVTLLQNGTDLSIAVSAYRDSENGLNKGAIWILNLGEISFTLMNPVNPSSCQSADGSVSISDLATNSIYSISYDIEGVPFTIEESSNENGQIQITGLNAGIYSDINVTEVSTGCSDNLGQVILDGTQINAQVSSVNPTSCSSNNGGIILSNLTASTTYSVSYELNEMLETFNITSDLNGEIWLSDLKVGTYENITIDDSSISCSGTVAPQVLQPSDSMVSTIYTSPSSCDSFNGSITILNLSPSLTYTISYDYISNTEELNVTASEEGEIRITGLGSGIYENIVLLENNNNCTLTADDVQLTCSIPDNECFRVKKFFTPNGDGINDLWNLILIGQCDYMLYIYDRQGKLLKMLTPDNPNWNGNFNGSRMPSTDYWFRVDYSHGGSSQSLVSHFSLKR